MSVEYLLINIYGIIPYRIDDIFATNLEES